MQILLPATKERYALCFPFHYPYILILYKRVGTILFDTDNNISGYYLSNYNENLPNATLSFTLGPNSFGKFGISSYDHHELQLLLVETGGYFFIYLQENNRIWRIIF